MNKNKLSFIFLFIAAAYLITQNPFLKETEPITFSSKSPSFTEDEEEIVCDEVELVRVVDGDTIVVNHNNQEEKIRLLEVNTPESVHSDESKNTEEGKEASEWTKNFLSNYRKLYLTYDEEKTDKYGRTLAYVWIQPDFDPEDVSDVKQYCLNALLLQNGMAEVTIYPPNDKYSSIFISLEQEAKNNNIGFWGRSDVF